jgi:hypothetical protein
MNNADLNNTLLNDIERIDIMCLLALGLILCRFQAISPLNCGAKGETRKR